MVEVVVDAVVDAVADVEITLEMLLIEIDAVGEVSTCSGVVVEIDDSFDTLVVEAGFVSFLILILGAIDGIATAS